MDDVIHVISLHVCAGSMKNYSYIVYKNHERKAIVIDPAWEFVKYLDIFKEYDLEPGAILLTHLHHDHINLTDLFLERYSIDLWAAVPAQNALKTVPNARFFQHKETLVLCDLPCTTYITPGHTPESSCFLIGDHFFTGDTLFIEGCGMCFGDSGDPKALYKSIQFLKDTLSPEIKIYPGHRYVEYPGIAYKEVLKKNIYLHIENEDTFIRFRMRPGQTQLFNFK